MRYANAVHELFVGIVEKLVEGLGVKSENIGYENWPCQFRINKYHFTPQSVGSPGVQIHTDSGFLTILQDDEGVGGLEVMNKSGEFIPVKPWSGTLLVNLGDMATVCLETTLFSCFCLGIVDTRSHQVTHSVFFTTCVYSDIMVSDRCGVMEDFAM